MDNEIKILYTGSRLEFSLTTSQQVSTRTGAAGIFNAGQGHPFNCEVVTKMLQFRDVRISRDVNGLDDLTPDKVYFAKIEMRQAA